MSYRPTVGFALVVCISGVQPKTCQLGINNEMISSEFNQGKLVAMSLPGGVEIRCDLPNKGRGLFAARDFADDDVLFEEMPLVCSQFLWNTLYKYLACDHCMRALETAEEASRRLANSAALELPHPELCDVKKEEHVTCPHCQVLYCSSVCQEAAWAQYHRTLCMGDSRVDSNHPLNKLQEVWRNINYPPETCSIMLIARMVATVRQAKDKAGAIQSFGQFCRATVNEEEEIAHKLLGKQFQQTLELLRTLTMEALYEEDLQQWFTPEGFRSLFALIGTNGQGVGTSSISVWVSHCEECQLPEAEKELLDNFIDKLYEDLDKVSGSFLNCEGSGLYRLQSTCNHSCEPNAEVSFPHNNSTLAVKALRDIKQGEEIFICYLDYCARERSRYSRQKILRENYLFNCSCSKCQTQANDPDGTSEEEMDDDDDDDDDEEDEEVAAAGESKR